MRDDRLLSPEVLEDVVRRTHLDLRETQEIVQRHERRIEVLETRLGFYVRIVGGIGSLVGAVMVGAAVRVLS